MEVLCRHATDGCGKRSRSYGVALCKFRVTDGVLVDARQVTDISGFLQ